MAVAMVVAMVMAMDTVMVGVMAEAPGLPVLPLVGRLDGPRGPGDLEAAAALGPHQVNILRLRCVWDGCGSF